VSILESADPIRHDLSSLERLEEHAERIARLRTLAGGETGRPLSPRVRDSGRVLLECYRAIAAVVREEGAITPAAEWFVAVLSIDPCIPRAWRRFEIAFRYHASRYEITVENPHGLTRGVCSMEVDGTPLPSGRASLPLTDDGATHRVRVVLG
jgi:hypothetical protein